jgi:hypothetical protein
VQPVPAGAPAGDGAADGRLSGDEARQAVKDALAIVPVIITRIEPWKIASLVPLERNPRTHSDEQIDQIAASMREFGFLWPIMVNGEAREIVAGNGPLNWLRGKEASPPCRVPCHRSARLLAVLRVDGLTPASLRPVPRFRPCRARRWAVASL